MAEATVTLPLHLWWSGPRRFDLTDPRDRARVVEIVLREGTAEDVADWLTLEMVREAWDQVVLPQRVRAVWQHLVNAS